MTSPYLSALANHIWQSTLFAAAAWLLTIILKKNRARVRHAVWLAATIKFIVPMALLTALGTQIHWRTAAAAPLPIAKALVQVSEPFSPVVSARPRWATPRGPAWISKLLFAVWLCGILAISWAWWIRLKRVRSALWGGTALELDAPVPAILSHANLEPGVVGIFTPVLLLPDRIFDHLTPPQIATVIAHELCHVRNYDNLAAAIQMFVETVFWFHPLVWWIGRRLLDERERACDEEVLAADGSDPRVYADAILEVCRMFVESPLACVAGVAGSDLRRRIEGIMENRQRQSMNYSKKALLCGAAIAALIAPVAIGVANAPALQAQAPATGSTEDQMLKLSQLKQPELGTLVNGRYHHTLTGTEFSIPAGWTITYQANSSGGGQQVGFTYPGDASGPKIEAFVWMRAEKQMEGEIPGKLDYSLSYKAGQRGAGPDSGYKMLMKTVERKTVGGQLALSVQAEWFLAGDPMIEYHTWVFSRNTHAYVSARMRPTDVKLGKVMVDGILDSLLVP